MEKIESGQVAIIVLHSPREKIWGILGEINASGVHIRGIDLNSFDDFVRAVQNGEAFYGISNQFFPMWRVERITKDDRTGDIPSAQEQFEQRTGVLLAEI